MTLYLKISRHAPRFNNFLRSKMLLKIKNKKTEKNSEKKHIRKRFEINFKSFFLTFIFFQ